MTILCGTLFLCSCQNDLLSPEEMKKQNLELIFGELSTFPDQQATPIYSDIKYEKVYNDTVFMQHPITMVKGYYVQRDRDYRVYGAQNLRAFNFNPVNSNWYPGAIVKGSSIWTGAFEEIPINHKRNSTPIYLNVMSGQSDMRYDEVIKEGKFSGSEVTQRMNEILSRHDGSYGGDVMYSKFDATSLYHIAYSLGMNESEFEIFSGGVFNSIDWSVPKTRFTVVLKQKYFDFVCNTLSVEDVFNSTINPSDFKSYVDANNPPCMIKSVSYGRMYVILYESNYSYDKVATAIDRAYRNESSDPVTPEDRKILNSIQVFIRAVGGNPEDVIGITKNPEKIAEYLSQGGKVDKSNVGVPIEAQLIYLHNGSFVINPIKVEGDYSTYEFVDAPKVNDIKINITKFRSEEITRAGGNYQLDGSSYYEVRNATYNVIDRRSGRVLKSETIHFLEVRKGLSAIDCSLSRQMVIGDVGKLGVDLKDITIELNIHRIEYGINRRKKIVGGINSGLDVKKVTYLLGIKFSYNPTSGKWEEGLSLGLGEHKDGNGAISDRKQFSFVKVEGNCNYGRINFYLDYSFSVNNKKY